MISLSETAVRPHVPVMLTEVLACLAPLQGTFLDATFGRGGYTKAILATPGTKVIALDRDAEAIAYGKKHFCDALQNERLTLHHARFSAIDTHTAEKSLDGAVFDLGVSSPQFEQAERGFSFQGDGPLDMRMGLGERRADTFLNNMPEKDIADVLYHLGGERRARHIARRVIEQRKQRAFRTTHDFVSLFPPKIKKPGAIHPATRSFQAIRLWVNEEMEELARALPQAARALKPGGRLVCVTFHSLEDRQAKTFLRPQKNAYASRHLPQSLDAPLAPPFQLLGKQPCTPSTQEIKDNPRARSAKLRWGTKRPGESDSNE